MNLLYLLIAILKFVGITLLIITLVLLFIIMLILLVPIKYQLYINKQDTIYVSTYIKWLFSFIGLEIVYKSEEETRRFISLCGKRVFTFKDKSKAKKKESQKQAKERKKGKKEKKVKKEKHKKEKSKNILKQVKNFHYKKELLEDTMIWIKKILEEIKPSKLYVDLEIGKDDPADTGKLIAKLSILYPFFHSIINIKGNYEKECFYAILETSGDITLGKFAYDFIQYIRTESVRQMIKFIKENRREKKDGRKITN